MGKFITAFGGVLLTMLLLGASCNDARADNLQWSWTAPTTRTDGTPFDMATEGSGYQVWFNDVQEVDANGDPLLLSAGANQLTKIFPAGQICAEFATKDVDGRVGPKSAPVCKDVLAPPGEPSNVTVTIIIQ